MQNFIEDTIDQLIEEAIELKGNANTEFEIGKLFGYFEVLQKIFNQLDAFGLSTKLSLKQPDFKPESLLSDIKDIL